MMEITAIGMGLMMTGVAVAIGGVTLEATFLMLGRALRSPPLAASVEPAVWRNAALDRYSMRAVSFDSR
jgi:hypothetical protein